MTKERHPSSCTWLFKSQEYKEWCAINNDIPIFWLSGRHGAGKSFLCGAAIEEIRRDARRPHVAIQFLRKGMEVSKFHVLQNLAYQLTKSLEAADGDLPDEITPLLEACKDDKGFFERLIPLLFARIQMAYIFIDGLDEASNWKDLQELVEFLVHEAVKAPGKIRVWFGSQPLPQIEECLAKNHGMHVIEKAVYIADTEADIKTYLASAIPESISDGSDFAQSLVHSSLETEVEGSFLWASSMISDLKEKAEDVDDMVRLARRRLPTRMAHSS